MNIRTKKRILIGLFAVIFIMGILPQESGWAKESELPIISGDKTPSTAEKEEVSVGGIRLVSSDCAKDSELLIVNTDAKASNLNKVDSLIFQIQNDNQHNRIYPFVIINGQYFEYCGAELGETFLHRSGRTLSGLSSLEFSPTWNWSSIDKFTGLGLIYFEIPIDSFVYRATFSNFGDSTSNAPKTDMRLSAYIEKSKEYQISSVGVRIARNEKETNTLTVGNIYARKGVALNTLYDSEKLKAGKWGSAKENTYFLAELGEYGKQGFLNNPKVYDLAAEKIKDGKNRLEGYFNGINLKEYVVKNSAEGEYMRISTATYQGSLKGKTIIIPYHDRAGNGAYFDMKLVKGDKDYGIDGAKIYYISPTGESLGTANSSWSVEPPSGFTGYICIYLDSITSDWALLKEKTGVSLAFGFFTGWNGEKLYDIDLGDIRIHSGDLGTEHIFSLGDLDEKKVIYPLYAPDTTDHIEEKIIVNGVMRNGIAIRSVEKKLDYDNSIIGSYPWLESAKIKDVRENPPTELLPKNNSFLCSAGIEVTGNRMWAATVTGGDTEPDSDNVYMIMYSDDNGVTWKNPAYVIDDANSSDNLRIYGGCLWKDPQGRLWIFYSQTDALFGTGTLPVGAFAYVIENPQDNPNKFRIVDKGLIGYGVFINKPTVITNENGEEEWIRSGHVTWTEYTDVYSSTDNGETWEYKGRAHGTAGGAHESQIVQLSNGKLMMTKRIDECASGGVEISYSSDYGVTWTEFESKLDEPFIAPSSRMNLYRLESGNLIFVANDNRTVWNNLTVYMSEDNGKTWPYSLVIDERGGAAYPDTVQVENGNIYVAYERGRIDQTELRYSMFTEKDIKAGKFVSSNHVYRRVITKNPKYQDVIKWTEELKNGVSFSKGTSLENLLDAIGNTVSVTTDQGNKVTLTGKWRCSYYNGNKPGTYLFRFQIYDGLFEDSYNLLTTKVTITTRGVPTPDESGKEDNKPTDTEQVGSDGRKPGDIGNEDFKKAIGVIGVVLIVLLLVGGFVLFIIKRNKKQKEGERRDLHE